MLHFQRRPAGRFSRAGIHESALHAVAIGLIGYTALALLERLTSFEWPAMPRPLRFSVYYAIIAGILFYGKFESRSFIYFQF